MLFMMVATHSPESCPAFNPKYRTITKNWAANAEAINKKYGIKTVGMWTDHGAHTIYGVFDAPNIEAVMGSFMEPVMHASLEYQTIRMFPILTMEETMKLIP